MDGECWTRTSERDIADWGVFNMYHNDMVYFAPLEGEESESESEEKHSTSEAARKKLIRPRESGIIPTQS